MARLGRSVGRMLLPAVMGVLIACIGWLMLTAVLIHPSFPAWLVNTPFVEMVEYLLGARSECVLPSDCVYLTGSQHQQRVHGVYVRSPRTCAGKPVYRQRGGEGLFLHSPAHENQWNVGPDVCDNSPRNKWMELYSPASTAAEIGNGTWFECVASLPPPPPKPHLKPIPNAPCALPSHARAPCWAVPFLSHFSLRRIIHRHLEQNPCPSRFPLASSPHDSPVATQ